MGSIGRRLLKDGHPAIKCYRERDATASVDYLQPPDSQQLALVSALALDSDFASSEPSWQHEAPGASEQQEESLQQSQTQDSQAQIPVSQQQASPEQHWAQLPHAAEDFAEVVHEPSKPATPRVAANAITKTEATEENLRTFIWCYLCRFELKWEIRSASGR